MVRVLISAVVSAIILFVWGFLAWGVLPLHKTSGGAFEDEAAVTAVLEGQAPESGVYWIPAMPEAGDEEGREAWQRKHEAGPVGMVVVHPEGRAVMPPSLLVTGFVVDLAGGLLISGLLFAARRSLPGYIGRVVFVGVLGVLVGVSADLKYWNWLYFPSDWTVMNVVDHAIGFALCGLAIGAIITPRAGRGESA